MKSNEKARYQQILAAVDVELEKSEVADWVEQQRVEDAAKMNDLMKTLAEILSQDTLEYLKPQLQIVKGKADKVIPSLAQEKKGRSACHGHGGMYRHTRLFHRQYRREHPQ